MDKLQARSALYSDYKAGSYGAGELQSITLSERRGLHMNNLAVWDNAAVNAQLASTQSLSLPGPGEAVNSDSGSILWTAPGRYLVVSEDAGLQDSLSKLPDDQGALQDLSCARTIIRVQGEASRHMMAKGLTVNLAKESFRTGQVILSSFDHHYPAIVHNVDSETAVFDIYITRSFALSFWHWLCDSSLEFGYQVLETENHG